MLNLTLEKKMSFNFLRFYIGNNCNYMPKKIDD